MIFNEKTPPEVMRRELQKIQDIRIHGNLGSEDLSKYDADLEKKGLLRELSQPAKEGDIVSKTSGDINIITNIIISSPDVDQEKVLQQLSKTMHRSPGMGILRKLFGD